MIDLAVLPERNEAAEDAWITMWHDHDDHDLLIELTRSAITARRPQLAARLFQMLDGRVEPEPGSALERASRAARLLLFRKAAPLDDATWYDLEEAWASVRRNRVRRIKRRWRDRLAGRNQTIRRHDRRRR